MNYKLLNCILFITIFFLTNNAFASDISENATEYSYDKYRSKVEYNYVNTDKNELTKYFNKEAKKIKKQWAKVSILKDEKYRTSYARVLFFVNDNGEILSYQIKSSCVPKGDTEFIKSVERTIAGVKKFDVVSNIYKHDILVFTIKFNSYIPKFRNTQNIDWNRYGVADLEISKNTLDVLMLEK